MTLFLQHGFAFNQFFDTVIFEDGKNNLVVFRGIQSSMHVRTAPLRVGLELFQVVIEMGQRMFFDFGREFAQLLPFRDGRRMCVPALHCCP